MSYEWRSNYLQLPDIGQKFTLFTFDMLTLVLYDIRENIIK